jgi:hypothetical protein
VEDLLAEDATTGDELWRAVWMEDLLNREDVTTADELQHGAWTVEEDLLLINYICHPRGVSSDTSQVSPDTSHKSSNTYNYENLDISQESSNTYRYQNPIS